MKQALVVAAILSALFSAAIPAARADIDDYNVSSGDPAAWQGPAPWGWGWYPGYGYGPYYGFGAYGWY